MSFYYKVAGGICANPPQWSIDLVGFNHQSKGDFIFRSLIHAISNNDRKMLIHCIELLKKKKRWPDELNHPLDRKHYRSQNSMTRDPYIMQLAAIYFIDKTLITIAADPPWWLYRSYYYNFKKYLLTDKLIYAIKFERQLLNILKWGISTTEISTFFHNRTWFIRGLRHKFGIHGYSIHLWAWMANISGFYSLKHEIRKLTPTSNLLIHLLCSSRNNLQIKEACNYYKAKEGYEWVKFKKLNKKILPKTDTIKISKDILNWAVKTF